MTDTVLMDVQGLELSFGGVVVAAGINFQIYEGRNLAIIGPNGAGKTTFLNICTGYLTPTAGQIMYNGRNVVGIAPRKLVKQGVARAFQIPQLFAEHSVRENILMAVSAAAHRAAPLTAMAAIPEADEAERILNMLKCAHIADRLVQELPEGQRKLIDIGMALALKPKLLFLDEPTSGVASTEKFAILEIIADALAQEKVTSVFVEHDEGIVERFADEVAVWNRGEVLFRGTPQDILSHPDVIRDVMGGHA